MSISVKVKLTVLVIILTIIAIMLFSLATGHKRNLDKFSNNLFNFPLPPKTMVLEKEKFGGKNWVDFGGSGGYWNVVAIMKMSSKLSKDEIIAYYDNVRFPYSKSNKPQKIEPEIYFEQDVQKLVHAEGFYYRDTGGRQRVVSSYDSINSENHNEDTVYILQIIDGYDYLLKLD